jgi:hypothetical protein
MVLRAPSRSPKVAVPTQSRRYWPGRVNSSLQRESVRIWLPRAYGDGPTVVVGARVVVLGAAVVVGARVVVLGAAVVVGARVVLLGAAVVVGARVVVLGTAVVVGARVVVEQCL